MTVHSPFIQPNSARAVDPENIAEPTPSWDARLSAVETAVTLISEAVSELADAVSNQNGALELLSVVHMRLAAAFTNSASTQESETTALADQIASQQVSLSELQELVSTLREEVADLEYDPEDVLYTADNLFIDMDDAEEGESILADLPFKMFDADSYAYTNTVSLEDEKSAVRVEDGFVVVSLPCPAHVEGMTTEALDATLRRIVASAHDLSLIDLKTADAIFRGIAGSLTYEEAAEVFPQTGTPGIAEAMAEWWDGEEAAELNFDVRSDAAAAISEIVIKAYVSSTMYTIAKAMVDAFNEE